MKKALKKLSVVAFIVVFLFLVMCPSVNALSGEAVIVFSGNNLKVGDTLKVTVRITADEQINAAEGTLNFDSSVLKFLDATGSDVRVDGSSIGFSVLGLDNILIKSFDFEVIAEGSCTISAKNIMISNGSAEVSVEQEAARFKTTATQNNNDTQDLNSNTKATLTSITVAAGTLTPAFNSNITEYTVIVPYTQTDGVLSCQSLDPKASISVEGNRQLQVGNNVRTIVVSASNGEIRRYTVTFNRLDENGNDITVSGNVSDIIVNVDGKDYNIAEQDATLEPPAGFSLATVEYGEKEVTAYKDASGKTVLLYLIEVGGEEGDFFLYENGQVSSFAYLSTADFTYIIKDVSEEAPEGLYKSTYDLNGKNVACYKYKDVELADFVVFSAISPEGNLGYYSFDVREQTVQRIVKFSAVAPAQTGEEITVNPAQKTVVVALLAIFAVLFVLLMVILVLRAAKKRGKNIGSIFDSEEEYEMESSSDYPDED